MLLARMLYSFLCEVEEKTGEHERMSEEKEEMVAFSLFLFACIGLHLLGLQGLGCVRQVLYH